MTCASSPGKHKHTSPGSPPPPSPHTRTSATRSTVLFRLLKAMSMVVSASRPAREAGRPFEHSRPTFAADSCVRRPCREQPHKDVVRPLRSAHVSQAWPLGLCSGCHGNSNRNKSRVMQLSTVALFANKHHPSFFPLSDPPPHKKNVGGGMQRFNTWLSQRE
jgi:hypothetical protein